jgi:hypothetical protein
MDPVTPTANYYTNLVTPAHLRPGATQDPTTAAEKGKIVFFKDFSYLLAACLDELIWTS